MNDQLLIAEQVAEWLKIKKSRVYFLVRENRIPVIVLGERQYRFSRQAIERWLDQGGILTEEGR